MHCNWTTDGGRQADGRRAGPAGHRYVGRRSKAGAAGDSAGPEQTGMGATGRGREAGRGCVTQGAMMGRDGCHGMSEG